jgi:DNA-binding PucR family transcriptional regulator
VARGTPLDEAVVHAALAGAAGALRDDLRPLSERVGVAVSAAVPALAADADVRLARERSAEANLADLLALLADPALPVDSGVPPEALALATTLVRRGVDPGDLVHAYLVAQNELWRAWMEELSGRLSSGPELIAALERSSARVFSRADFLVAALIRHVDRERERLMGGALARRSRLVRALLAGDESDAAEASRTLGYELERWVLAAVHWGAGDDALEAHAALLARAAGAPRALTFAPGEGSVWAWVGTPEQPDLDRIGAALGDALSEREGVALGTAGQGLAGFRLGHQEALHARRIAELGAATGVVRYDEVEAVSLLSADPDRLARFVRRTLGGLIADDPATARLRETLLAWLAEGGNARRAAERLHAHKNTVLYRLQRAQLIIGRPLDRDRGELELALAALQRLGPRVSGQPD